jgi:hypothetical protein
LASAIKQAVSTAAAKVTNATMAPSGPSKGKKGKKKR